MLENLFFSSPRIKRIACVAFDGSSSCRMLNVFTIFSNLCRKSLIVTDRVGARLQSSFNRVLVYSEVSKTIEIFNMQKQKQSGKAASTPNFSQ